MNKLKQIVKAVYQYKMTLLFVILWAHVSILNLFYVNYSGPVFLWQENSEPLTVQIHVLIALVSVLFYQLCNKLCGTYKRKKNLNE